MANSFSALNPTNFMPMVQDFLNAMMVAKAISRTEFRAQLKSGSTIDFPYVTDLRVQDYTTGTDLTIDANTATSDTMSIDQSRAATFTLGPNEIAQMEDKSLQAKYARQAAYRISNDIDQKLFTAGVNGADGTVAGGALTSSTILQYLTEARATLVNANGADGPLYAVLDPDRIALLAQAFIANGFGQADASLLNGFQGRAVGFDVYESVNLPTSATLTMATNPTADDTVTIKGVTFTFKATPSNAGEVDVGTDAATSQTNLRNAVNGTGTPGATSYIALSTANRRKLTNAGVSMGAWATNAAVVTAYGKQANSETFTATADGWGTETSQALVGRKGATSLGLQIEPTMYEGKEPKRPETNFIIHTLFGTKVFNQDTFRLCKLTHNM